MATDIEELAAELLRATYDDWSDVGWGRGIAADAGLTGQEAVDAGLDVVEVGLVRGWLVAGSIDLGHFEAWPEQGSAAADRIRREWAAAGDDPDPFSIGWLDITPNGVEYVDNLDAHTTSSRRGGSR